MLVDREKIIICSPRLVSYIWNNMLPDDSRRESFFTIEVKFGCNKDNSFLTRLQRITKWVIYYFERFFVLMVRILEKSSLHTEKTIFQCRCSHTHLGWRVLMVRFIDMKVVRPNSYWRVTRWTVQVISGYSTIPLITSWKELYSCGRRILKNIFKHGQQNGLIEIHRIRSTDKKMRPPILLRNNTFVRSTKLVTIIDTNLKSYLRRIVETCRK